MIDLNPKYKSLFQSNTRYFIITGGRGSSKSFSVGTFLSLLSFEQNEKILFTRKTMISAHISVIPEFKDKIERLEKEEYFEITKTDITNNLSNSQILFRGLQSSSGDNTANLKSLQGVTCWVLDEAEELTDEVLFDRIDLSVRHLEKQNRIILVMNPTTKESWIYKRFFEGKGVNPGFNGTNDNVTYIHTDYRDNIQYLPKDFISQIENLKESNPIRFEHVILGGWLDKAEGVIYTNWKVGNFEEASVPVWGMDFGFSIDPTTLVKVCIDKSRKKIFAKEYFYRPKLTTSEIYSLSKNYVGEGLIYGDSAEPRLIEELKSAGLNIKGTEKGPGSITAGIAAIQDYELIVDPGSINLIKELNNYVWNDKKSETPIDAYNHCFIGSTLITTDKGLIPLKEIKEGDYVLTSKGFKKVLKKFNNGLQQVNKYTMKTDTFSVSLCSTKEHKIKSTKWEKISELQSGMMVYQHKHSMGLYLDYFQKKGIFQGGQSEFMYMYGSTLTVKRLKGTISTTKTIIHGITQLIISNALRAKNTFQNTLKKGLKITQSLQKNSNQKELRKRKSGTAQLKVGFGIQSMEKKHGLIENTTNINASNAELNLNHDTGVLSDFAITTAKLKHFEQGESWMEEVYDLHVSECHEYFANGILVHNCIDALRYACYPTLKPQKDFFVF